MKCQEIYSVFKVFRCATSEKYFSEYTINKFQSSSTMIKLSNLCPHDPGNYQSCGLVNKNEVINSGGVFCNTVVCQVDETTLPIWSRTYSDQGQMECRASYNFSTTCRPQLNPSTCEKFLDKRMKVIKFCDMICQDKLTCIDEAECNGFLYGKFCRRKGKMHYVSTFRISDGKIDCDVDHSDETQFTDNSLNKTDFTFCFNNAQYFTMALIKNYTRCGPLQITDPYQIKRSFCNDFSDQLNCSDPNRGVLTCSIRGYPSTISRAAICLDTVNFCDDGLDRKCKQTSTSCLVHRHLVCDGIEDCEDASDEQEIYCEVVLSTKCFRRSVNTSQLTIFIITATVYKLRIGAEMFYVSHTNFGI